MSDLAHIAPGSRLWIYQSSTELTPAQEEILGREACAFLEEWTSHGSRMDAALEILHRRFVILAVDECTAPASGCGVDKSVRFIQEMEKKLGIVLLDRMSVAYQDGEKITACSLPEFQELIRAGKVNEDTLVFNNLVETRGQLENAWRIPLKNSWYARLLAASAKAS